MRTDTNSMRSRSCNGLRVYSANYVEPPPPPQDTRDAAARRDSGIQTGFLDRTRRQDH